MMQQQMLTDGCENGLTKDAVQNNIVVNTKYW